MKSFAAAAALVALVPSVLGLTINTPVNVVECQPVQFTWADGTPPYFLSLLPANQPSAAAIKTFPQQQSTSFTWNVDISGSFSISLKDSTGTQAFSSEVDIQNGDSSCLNSAVSDNGSATGGASATAASSGAASSSGSRSGSATASGASSTSSSNSAPRSNAAAYGLAGVMGLVGAALF